MTPAAHNPTDAQLAEWLKGKECTVAGFTYNLPFVVESPERITGIDSANLMVSPRTEPATHKSVARILNLHFARELGVGCFGKNQNPSSNPKDYFVKAPGHNPDGLSIDQVGNGYRLLEKGETTIIGDELKIYGGWHPCGIQGREVGAINAENMYRRKLTPASEELTKDEEMTSEGWSVWRPVADGQKKLPVFRYRKRQAPQPLDWSGRVIYDSAGNIISDERKPKPIAVEWFPVESGKMPLANEVVLWWREDRKMQVTGTYNEMNKYGMADSVITHWARIPQVEPPKGGGA